MLANIYHAIWHKCIFKSLEDVQDGYGINKMATGGWPPAAILDDRKSLLIAFLAISDQYAVFLFFEILDDRKSFSIAFLAISDQYATFLCLKFLTKWPPAATLDDRKSR